METTSTQDYASPQVIILGDVEETTLGMLVGPIEEADTGLGDRFDPSN